MALDQLTDAHLEPPAADRTNLETEAAQYPADAALDVEQLALHQLARSQQRSHLLRARRLGVHRPIPAKPQQLGDAASIAPVGLHTSSPTRPPSRAGSRAAPLRTRLRPARHGATATTGLPRDRPAQSPDADRARSRSGLPARSPPSLRARSRPARRRCTRCSVLKRRPIRHNAPRLSSIRLAGRRGTSPETPSLHHDRGTATPPAELEVRPITVSFDPFLPVAAGRPLSTQAISVTRVKRRR